MTLNEEIKNILIKYFTRVYGENSREFITKMINSIVPILYDSIDTKEQEMAEKLREKNIELTLKFLNHSGIEIDKSLTNKIISNNEISYIDDFQKASEFLKRIFGTYNYKKDASIKDILFVPTEDEYKIYICVQALKTYGVEIEESQFNEWVLSEDAKPILDQIKKEIEYLQTLDQEYDEFNKQFESTYELINKRNDIREKLLEKYEIKFLNSIKKYLTPHDKELLEEFNKKEEHTWIDKYNLYKSLDIFKIIDTNLNTVGIIESFSQKSEDMLKDPNTSAYKRSIIIEDRIKYFKLIGIYDENIPPEEFIESEIAKQNEPDKSFIEDIINGKREHLKKIDEELLLATSTYEENKMLIDSLMLIEQPNFTPEKIANKLIAIIPAAKQTPNGPQLTPLLVFSPGAALYGYKDVNFIHEINHAIETAITGQDKNGNLVYKTGFEYEVNDNNDNRPYEFFSENINQLIAMEIATMMHNDGVYIFDNPKTAKIYGSTHYESFNCFTLDFYNAFKQNIIDARTSNNLDSLHEVVGKCYFEELNRIINEYASMPITQIMATITRKQTNDLTMKREELINHSQEIFESMLANKDMVVKK